MDAETTLPIQATKLPQPSLALSDPHAYLAQRKFHQSLRCPRTHKRFTYADVGDVAGPPVLVFLPSFCSRWLAVMVDGLANEVGVRLIAMDRCGSGGTEPCALNDRVDVTCDMTESLLEHLQLPEVMMIACSGGMISMLEYIRRHPQRFFKRCPTVSLISPWFPGNVYLPWIPASVLASVHLFVPFFQASGNVLSGSKDWMSALPSWSSSSTTSPPTSTEAMSKPERKPTEEMVLEEGSRIARRFMPPKTIKLLQEYTFAESQQGLSQEYLLCLGKGVTGSGAHKTGSREWYAAVIDTLQIHFRSASEPTRSRLAIKTWWGDNDGLIPRDARDALNGLFERSPAVRFACRVLPGADHDEPMISMEGLGEALVVLRQRADQAGWAPRAR